jgi:hypothetical protein
LRAWASFVGEVYSRDKKREKIENGSKRGRWSNS